MCRPRGRWTTRVRHGGASRGRGGRWGPVQGTQWALVRRRNRWSNHPGGKHRAPAPSHPVGRGVPLSGTRGGCRLHATPGIARLGRVYRGGPAQAPQPRDGRRRGRVPPRGSALRDRRATGGSWWRKVWRGNMDRRASCGRGQRASTGQGRLVLEDLQPEASRSPERIGRGDRRVVEGLGQCLNNQAPEKSGARGAATKVGVPGRPLGCRAEPHGRITDRISRECLRAEGAA